MNNHNINVKVLVLHVFAGWLIASQMTITHIRMAELTNEASFVLGMLGSMAGCFLGFMAYQKRWFLKDE